MYQPTTVKHILDSDVKLIDQTFKISGWVYAIRVQGNQTFGFASIMDNTTVRHLQVIFNLEKATHPDSIKSALKRIHKGSVITVLGQLTACPEGKNVIQKTELIAHQVILYGDVASDHYPVAKQKMPLDTLRPYPHLRSKSKSMTAINIIRNKASNLIHTFWQREGYHWIQTPILTSNDCEGAGEAFHVITPPEKKQLAQSAAADLVQFDAKSFFRRQVNLTVSGQLHLESLVHSLFKVYTFGPTFRADPSETTRHLAEFWMVEPEIAFVSLPELMDLSESFIRFLVSGILDQQMDEVKYLEAEHHPGLLTHLTTIAKQPFQKISYTEAVNILIQDIENYKIRVISPDTSAKDRKKYAKKAYLIQEMPCWGMDLKSEHEKYLTDIVFQKPVIIYHYPKTLKPFYMKPSTTSYDEGEVVDAMDVLIPGLGELVGGSIREDDFDRLADQMKQHGLVEELKWYLDLRQYGSLPHGGFGLGFERLIMILTGVHNIKDVIPFPRFSGHCVA